VSIDLPTSVKGLDGKTYPARWLDAEDRAALIGIVHQLHCAEHLSIRQLLARIQERHEIRRSVGWAAGVLANYRCGSCSGDRNGTPEQPAEQEPK
jgi:hypothetical protein